jgi:Lon-like protease
VTRIITPGRMIVAGLVVLAAVIGALWLLPSNTYIFLPDRAHPVSALVSVPKNRERADRGGGGIYFVDVFVRKARLFERLFPWIHEGATLYPGTSILPCGTTAHQQEQADQNEMTRSQQIAAVVALRALGYRVQSTSNGVLIDSVACDSPALGKLQSTEVLVGVDGKPVQTTHQLFTAMGRHRPGDAVRLAVRGPAGLRNISVRTVADPSNRKRALIGISVEPSFRAKLPFPIRIDANGVGGPSAGLAFALDLMEKLGRNVDRGYKVAATGQLDPDGTVEPIGGVEQKTIGARRAGVDVFLVPAGDNAREARRYAHGLRIIPVESFRQALRALATLPPRD